MPRNKISKKKKKKFRILLDSAFARIDSFPRLKKRANLAHAVYDLGLARQAEDKDIYHMAEKQNRFVLTINFKDFRKFTKRRKIGILGIDSQLTNSEIDEIVSSFISGKDPDDYKGKAIKL